jgi:hypothetical protein
MAGYFLRKYAGYELFYEVQPALVDVCDDDGRGARGAT